MCKFKIAHPQHHHHQNKWQQMPKLQQQIRVVSFSTQMVQLNNYNDVERRTVKILLIRQIVNSH